MAQECGYPHPSSLIKDYFGSQSSMRVWSCGDMKFSMGPKKDFIETIILGS